MQNTITTSNTRKINGTLLLTIWLKEEEPPGGWVVAVWGLPGCATQGETEKEAEAAIADCFVGFEKAHEELGEEMEWDANYEPFDGKGELRWVWIR